MIDTESNIEAYSISRFSDLRKDRVVDSSWNYICGNFILVPDKKAFIYTEELHAHSIHFEFNVSFFDEDTYRQAYNEFLEREVKLYYECVECFSQKGIKLSIRAGVTLPNEPAPQALDKNVYRFYDNEFRNVDFWYGMAHLEEDQKKWLYQNMDLFF